MKKQTELEKKLAITKENAEPQSDEPTILITQITLEGLARVFHSIYQKEAKRQGDVRYKDDYKDLPKNIKEFDRVLARYVLKNFGSAITREKIIKVLKDYYFEDEEDIKLFNKIANEILEEK